MTEDDQFLPPESFVKADREQRQKRKVVEAEDEGGRVVKTGGKLSSHATFSNMEKPSLDERSLRNLMGA